MSGQTQTNHEAGCLCEGVRFRVRGPLGPALNCHCSLCRKAHSAAFRTRVSVATGDLTWLQGEDLVRGYETSPGAARLFCSRCGTRLMTTMPAIRMMGVPLALFDEDPGVRPQLHCYVASKAPWFEITDNLPQFPEAPPAAAVRPGAAERAGRD